MIIDCFIFNHELEVLNIRLHELDPVVDRFVLVESALTFTGLPKPLHFQQNKHLFDRFLGKIRHVVFTPDDESHSIEANWLRQKQQRNSIMEGLTDCRDEDIILISDVDEIPRAEVVSGYNSGEVMHLQQMGFSLFLNLISGPWPMAKILPFSVLKSSTPNSIRHGSAGTINGAGWHFNFVGGPEMVKLKLESCCHVEYNTLELADPERPRRLVKEGKLAVAMITNFFPKYVVNNKERLTKDGYIYNP